MRDTRIILVEGMPGTGKSTVSQFIHRQLKANGQPSYWCHEEHAAHPVRLFYDPERHPSWSAYCDEAASRWESYVNELQSRHQLAVLDAAVLQNHVRTMLLFDCDSSPMLDLVRRIEQLLVPLRPAWIYLKPIDVEQNFRKVVAARGERLLDLWIQEPERFPYGRRSRATGFAGLIAFWEEFGRIADRAFDELTTAKLRQVAGGGDWMGRAGELLRFLDVRLPCDSSAPILERYTGNYMRLDDDAAPRFVLRARDGCLIIACDNPTMDVQRGPIGCFRETRLIPAGNDRFYVEAWPHEVEFSEDPLGTVVSMRLSVSEDGWTKCSDVYVRR